jgi:hypothetical protein
MRSSPKKPKGRNATVLRVRCSTPQPDDHRVKSYDYRPVDYDLLLRPSVHGDGVYECERCGQPVSVMHMPKTTPMGRWRARSRLGSALLASLVIGAAGSILLPHNVPSSGGAAALLLLGLFGTTAILTGLLDADYRASDPTMSGTHTHQVRRHSRPAYHELDWRATITIECVQRAWQLPAGASQTTVQFEFKLGQVFVESGVADRTRVFVRPCPVCNEQLTIRCSSVADASGSLIGGEVCRLVGYIESWRYVGTGGEITVYSHNVKGFKRETFPTFA